MKHEERAWSWVAGEGVPPLEALPDIAAPDAAPTPDEMSGQSWSADIADLEPAPPRSYTYIAVDSAVCASNNEAFKVALAANPDTEHEEGTEAWLGVRSPDEVCRLVDEAGAEEDAWYMYEEVRRALYDTPLDDIDPESAVNGVLVWRVGEGTPPSDEVARHTCNKDLGTICPYRGREQ